MSFPVSPEPAADAEATESPTFRDLGIDDDLIEVLDDAGIDAPFPIRK